MRTLKQPKVSILLPSYNRAYLLPFTIENILEQTWKDWELIIVDDGSLDNTDEVIKNFDDRRITYIKHQVNAGEAAARNTALAAARGEYIANQDSDDEWFPEKLEEEVYLLDRSPARVGAVYSSFHKTLFDGSEEIVPSAIHHQKEGNLVNTFLRSDFYITGQALLIKKECYKNVGGYDEKLRVLNDAEFLIRLASQYEFVHNPHVRVRIKRFEDSISRNFKMRLVSREYILHKHEDLFKKFPDSFARYSYRIGHTHALLGNTDKARMYLRKAFVFSPLHIKYIAAFLLSLTASSWLYRTLGRLKTKWM
ncbi:MAG: hypothetical protein A3C80_00545 [Candidatus Ryanbacteria bacterium RIFCSPHIGHO2_02_FULL_45_43]|uniref:Glycosyltransferase 2-like domain-containing protein n=1 Tax=Candidatus Ryanbacteria bacterium RIFCSPHIGHO2_01_45_13 TaxID=1802112 RepID=A0A1G2FXA6_9BACT|nr:MAG: hypothetical protein A2718_01935 [Candidatus Ryanbacteria bacterium RIFCSPHIGHO2_01_FULL_44_130]OGZ42709.1 MAG: hypothetical protein A2W41_03130 [Candidatus Ryanbacteria bacterium RIFCSPHIGHO2_01_45_13]OGZ48803.1 MAG: hypothetical protein A3C80_00545 [Candidatus Ryanbacteria bacterium RIFCSPHIGHO2_02_FULL_45_43]OGZ52046.1 MAG: hypothetical protein A3A17_01150 [Candidatus Ryanbacteria bacterium RIFCSPLOWO2_01_FULL_44_230]OGZ54951.1 MAG: hypothetical protein A3F85_02175 [Candidatus Ryanba